MAASKSPVESRQRIAEVASAASSSMSTIDSEWEPTGTEGFWVKRLYEDDARGERTWFMRIDAGAYSPPPAHAEFAQVYVVEGSFFDDDRLVKAGEFCARSPGAMHSAASDEGALMIVIYTRA